MVPLLNAEIDSIQSILSRGLKRPSSLDNVHLIVDASNNNFSIYISHVNTVEDLEVKLDIVFLGFYNNVTGETTLKTDMMWPDDHKFIYNMARLYDNVDLPVVKTYLTQVLKDFFSCNNQIPNTVMNLKKLKRLKYGDLPTREQFKSVLKSQYEKNFDTKRIDFTGFRMTELPALATSEKGQMCSFLTINKSINQMRLVVLEFQQLLLGYCPGVNQVIANNLEKPEKEREVISIEAANNLNAENCLDDYKPTVVSSALTTDLIPTRTSFKDLTSGKIKVDHKKKFYIENDTLYMFYIASKKIYRMCDDVYNFYHNIGDYYVFFDKEAKDWSQESKNCYEEYRDKAISDRTCLNNATAAKKKILKQIKEANLKILLSSNEEKKPKVEAKLKLMKDLEEHRQDIAKYKESINKMNDEIAKKCNGFYQRHEFKRLCSFSVGTRLNKKRCQQA